MSDSERDSCYQEQNREEDKVRNRQYTVGSTELLHLKKNDLFLASNSDNYIQNQ